MATVGERIKFLRRQRGWTLRELSAHCGVSVSHLSAIENHTRPSPSLERIQRIAHAFEVSLAVFDEAVNSAGQLEQAVNNARSSEPYQTGPASVGVQSSLVEQLQTLYDQQTIAFIAAESARPYVELARALAESDPDDPSAFLQRIATFIQERKGHYGTNTPPL